MRHFITALVITGFCTPVAAHAAGIYGRVEAGIVSSDVSGAITDLPLGGFLGLGLGSDPDSSTDSGFASFAVIGADLASGFKLEAELGYSSASLSDATDISETTAMANALFALKVASSIDLVVGAGLGFTSYSWDSYVTMPVFSSSEESDTGFAYQAIAGVDVGLGDGLDLSLRYRYRMADVDMTGASVKFETGTALANLDGLDSHALTVGLTFGF